MLRKLIPSLGIALLLSCAPAAVRSEEQPPENHVVSKTQMSAEVGYTEGESGIFRYTFDDGTICFSRMGNYYGRMSGLSCFPGPNHR